MSMRHFEKLLYHLSSPKSLNGSSSWIILQTCRVVQVPFWGLLQDHIDLVPLGYFRLAVHIKVERQRWRQRRNSSTQSVRRSVENLPKTGLPRSYLAGWLPFILLLFRDWVRLHRSFQHNSTQQHSESHGFLLRQAY